MVDLRPQDGKYKEFYEEMVRKEEGGGKSQAGDEGGARPLSSRARGGRGRGAARAGRR